jgi:hypothetical protein
MRTATMIATTIAMTIPAIAPEEIGDEWCDADEVDIVAPGAPIVDLVGELDAEADVVEVAF